MRGSHQVTPWTGSLLSLVLLVANVGAPFRVSDLGRTLLGSVPQNACAGPIVRVRVVSASGLTHGFRAIIGLARGGPDNEEPAASPHPSLALRSSPAAILPARPVDRALSRPQPPLRC